MTQLEVLKQDLAALAERINSAIAVSGDSVTLTRQQLRAFANAIQSETIEKVKNEIENVNIDIADHVTIELNRLELEVLVEVSDVLSEIVDSMNEPDEVTDEDVQTYLDALEE